MAKYREPYEDTQELFDTVLSETGLERMVNVTVLSQDNLKEITKVSKANDLVKHMTQFDVVVIVNEIIYDQLTDDQKRIVVEEAISHISYDTENDKLVISKPDFVAHSGVLRKYGFETMERLRETVKSLYQAQKEEQDESEVINGDA